MNMLLVDENNKFIIDEYGQILLDEKPNLGFAYEAISFSHTDKTKWVRIGGELIEASIEQPERERIERYIAAKRSEYGVRIMAVDGRGFYLGVVREDDPRVAQRVLSSPPNGDDWVYSESGEWVRVYGFSSEGEPVRITHDEYVGHTVKPLPELAKVMPFKWDPESDEWEFRGMSAEQWAAVQAQEILFGATAAIIHGFKSSMQEDQKVANQYLRGLIHAVAEHSRKWAQDLKDEALKDKLLKIVAEMDTLFASMDQGDRVKVQDAYNTFCAKVDQISGSGRASLQSMDISNLVLDQYVANN